MNHEVSKARSRRYAQLVEETRRILFEEDPAGINFEFNTDEYDPEVGTILPELAKCSSEDEARALVRRELRKWFGPGTILSEERAERAAERIWRTWSGLQADAGDP